LLDGSVHCNIMSASTCHTVRIEVYIYQDGILIMLCRISSIKFVICRISLPAVLLRIGRCLVSFHSAHARRLFIEASVPIFTVDLSAHVPSLIVVRVFIW
jgi:hypothetical protein